MLFNSLAFLFFFPVVTIGYFLLPHRIRWSWLLLASCYFYMFFKPVYILILFFTIAVDYGAGIWIEKSRDKKKRKLLLIASIIANTGVLAFFKYYNFINTVIGDALGIPDHSGLFPALNILLPVGLSFHTFQAMSYTIEIYRGRQQAERHAGYYALYVMFYPQLVAGPIERPYQLLPQLREKHFFDYDRISSGLRRMLWGFFKKMVIADRLSVIVNTVFAHPGEYHGFPVLWGVIFFSIQIYADFSGYCDIALGSARVMGFNLMENFRFPYFSRSIREFWQRWHISLSTWFRDYVYIPMGGNRQGGFRGIFNIMIVFMISGLWHGAGWTFVVWGAIHGILLLVTRAWPFPIPAWAGRLATFFSVTLAWIFFRASTFSDAITLLKGIIPVPGVGFIGIPVISTASFVTVWLLIFLLLVAEWNIFRRNDREGWLNVAVGRTGKYAINLALILGLLLFGVFEEQSFIYFQF
ncbi:MAG: MBOAT family protein [Bacteroidia bacterium]|nr:MBOAT family protein [Bacteroidia bacterium]